MFWSHLSPIPGHLMGADFDCTSVNAEAKFAVAGDFDGDSIVEIAIAANVSGTVGNDFWVMKMSSNAWHHMSPLPGHPMDADFDCSGTRYAAKFAVAGDFDGDGQVEIAIAPETGGTLGNDFWVMKFDKATGTWYHLSPIPGHGMDADFDCSGTRYAAKFAVAGDFDGDGQVEIAIAPDASGTLGNDFWVMKFDKVSGSWNHLSPIPGHGIDADFDCSGSRYAAKFAVVGDFDGDGQAEIAIAPDASGTLGNDFWVMKFDKVSGSWNHLSPIPGHGIHADLDCSGLNFAAKFAVAGDFDGDGKAEIAVAPDARNSAGNDFWVMKFDMLSGSWNHLSPIPGHPMQADFDCTVAKLTAKFAVTGKFSYERSTLSRFKDEIAIAPDVAGTQGNDFWVMKYDETVGKWHHSSPISGHGFDADLDCSGLGFPAKFAVTGRFEGDERDRIAVAPDARRSGGNDFWTMGLFDQLQDLMTTLSGSVTITIAPMTVSVFGTTQTINTPTTVSIAMSLKLDRFRRAVEIASFPPITSTTTTGSVTTTTVVTKIGGGTGSFDKATGVLTMGIVLRFVTTSSSFPISDTSDVTIILSTGATASVPTGLSAVGVPFDAATGKITLVGAARYSSGLLAAHDCLLAVVGSIIPRP